GASVGWIHIETITGNGAFGANGSAIATGTGAGVVAHAQLLDATTHQVRVDTMPFDAFVGGIEVAAGDLTGDAIPDLVVISGAGPMTHVKAFDGVDGSLLSSFLPFPGFTGGGSVAVGDLDGDGFGDIVVGAGPGAPGGHVKAFTGVTGAEIRSFF